MSIKLTYGQIRDHNFGRAFGKIASFGGYKSVSVAINLAKMNKRILEEARLADEQFLALVKKFAVLNDQGEPLTPEGGQMGEFTVLPEKKAEWEAAVKEFLAYEFELPGRALPPEDLLPAGVSPLDFSFLDCLLAPFLESV